MNVDYVESSTLLLLLLLSNDYVEPSTRLLLLSIDYVEPSTRLQIESLEMLLDEASILLCHISLTKHRIYTLFSGLLDNIKFKFQIQVTLIKYK